MMTTTGKTRIAEKLAEYHPWWDKLIFVGAMGNVTVYIPTKSISGIGAEGKLFEITDRMVEVES